MLNQWSSEYELQLRLCTNQETRPLVQNVATFLRNLNRLYDFCRIIIHPYEDQSKFDSIGRQNGWPLNPTYRLYLIKLKHESPFEIITVAGLSMAALAALGGVVAKIASIQKGFYDVIHSKLDVELARAKVSTEKLNQEKLKAEIRRLERQTLGLETDSPSSLRATPTEMVENPMILEKLCGSLAIQENRVKAVTVLHDTLEQIRSSEIIIVEAEISIHKSPQS